MFVTRPLSNPFQNEKRSLKDIKAIKNKIEIIHRASKDQDIERTYSTNSGIRAEGPTNRETNI